MPALRTKLNIADIIIAFRSKFLLEELIPEKAKWSHPERFMNFFYQGNKEPDISIEVEIVKKISRPQNAKTLFVTYHPQDGYENWRLYRQKDKYIYYSALGGAREMMHVNTAFNRVTAYLTPMPNKHLTWEVSDIIYDFLQVLLINYLAQRRAGIFAHAVGIKDLNGKGFLFGGKSGSGKSTTARLWHQHSGAMVLNDDRIIVRKKKGRFMMYGSPWHGGFGDYLDSRIESACLSKIFFLHQFSKNKASKITSGEAFLRLYPATFPAFWDAGFLKNIISFSEELVNKVECLDLGFVNNKSVVSFVRNIAAHIK